MRHLLILTFIFWTIPSLSYLSVENFKKDQSPKKLLVFLSQKCPCSQSHVEHINEMAKTNKNIPFYGVIVDPWDDESINDIKTYFSKKRFSFPIIKDPEQKLIKQYGALKTPHITILEKTKKSYKSIYDGGVSNHRFFQSSTKQFLKENLKALKLNKAPIYKNGPSLGCYIRRI